MISSDGPGGRFLIATPTKCGTTTMEELARRHAGGRISRGGVWKDNFRIMDWEKPRRQHRMVPPVGWESADRYLLVRNPWDRYVSIWYHLSHPANFSQWGAREVQGRKWRGPAEKRGGGEPMNLVQFLEWYCGQRTVCSERRMSKLRGPMSLPRAYRSPWVWLDSLPSSWEFLRNAVPADEDARVGYLRLEKLWGDLAVLKARYGLDNLSLRASIHANRSVRRSVFVVRGGSGQVFREIAKEVMCQRVARGVACECVLCRLGVIDEAEELGYRLL